MRRVLATGLNFWIAAARAPIVHSLLMPETDHSGPAAEVILRRDRCPVIPAIATLSHCVE
jgi:hypothetical protein